MRKVILDGRDGPHPDERLRDKLAGHLNARLTEYAKEGISSFVEAPGVVLARFSGADGEDAVRQLALSGVATEAAGERVRFVIGPTVTFEDLDYVQSAAANLL